MTDADGGTASDTFVLTVTAANDLPTISDVTDTDDHRGHGDVRRSASRSATRKPRRPALTFTATSSNAALVPTGNIVFGGRIAARPSRSPRRRIRSAPHLTITVTDADGGTASDTFVLTVNPVNDPPVVSAGPI